MFRRLPDPRSAVAITVDGRNILARDGDSVAAALLASGMTVFRVSAVSGSERGAWCGMGTCFECLVTIDGRPNMQACLTPVAPGMAITTRQAAPDLASGKPS